MKIGEQLKIQREQRGWSQQILADRLKISRQSVSKWEQGTALPSFANVVLISDLFNLTIDDLVRDDTDLRRTFDRPVTGPLGLIVVGGLGVAIPLAVVALALGIHTATLLDWVQTPLLIGVIILLGLIYRNQQRRQYALSRVVIAVAIAVLGLLLMPQITDFIIGFWNGLRAQG